MAIHEEVKEAVGNVNYKIGGEYSAIHFAHVLDDARQNVKIVNSNLIRGNDRLQGMLDHATGKMVKGLVEMDMEESKSLVKLDSGIDPISQGHHLASGYHQVNQILPNLVTQYNGLATQVSQLTDLVTKMATKG